MKRIWPAELKVKMFKYFQMHVWDTIVPVQMTKLLNWVMRRFRQWSPFRWNLWSKPGKASKISPLWNHSSQDYTPLPQNCEVLTWIKRGHFCNTSFQYWSSPLCELKKANQEWGKLKKIIENHVTIILKEKWLWFMGKPNSCALFVLKGIIGHLINETL